MTFVPAVQADTDLLPNLISCYGRSVVVNHMIMWAIEQ